MRDWRSPIEFDQAAFTSEKTGPLIHLVGMLCKAFGERSSMLDHPLLRDRLVSVLASGLLLALPHNCSDIAASETPIAPACVRRAELFMEENLRQPIGLGDLARAAGVSARALQFAFRRFRETSPTARLRALRLEMARSDLARADPDASSVAGVAAACGFGHLSRFAADYKARFGELPAETLRRRRLFAGPKREAP
jgi:AraC-like DNA-binding protein